MNINMEVGDGLRYIDPIYAKPGPPPPPPPIRRAPPPPPPPPPSNKTTTENPARLSSNPNYRQPGMGMRVGGGGGILGTIISVIIILFILAIFAFAVFFGHSSSSSTTVTSVGSQQSVGSTSYTTTVNTTNFCVAASGFQCQSPVYSSSTNKLNVQVGQTSGYPWTSANITFIPQTAPYKNITYANTTYQIPNVSFSSPSAVAFTTGLQSGQWVTTSLSVPSTAIVGGNVTGTIWARYTVSYASGYYYAEIANVSVPS